MRLAFINDIEVSQITSTQYDLVIFACGYESRCTSISSMLDINHVKKALIFGFEYIGVNQLRTDNDNHFINKWGVSPKLISSENDMVVYETLNAEVTEGVPYRILVDYSSMSRTWYAAILNWVRFNEFGKDIILDFVYSTGSYLNDFSPIAVKSILPLPGCEGSSGITTKSIAIFGLGFEGLAPLCVLDKLQPDVIFTYMASPAVNVEYPEKTKDKNKELITRAKENFEFPLTSVGITFTKLVEVVSPYLGAGDITLIPMGPKPHVLAAIILAIRFDQITCLHVNGRSKAPEDVISSGNFIATQLTFKPAPEIFEV